MVAVRFPSLRSHSAPNTKVRVVLVTLHKMILLVREVHLWMLERVNVVSESYMNDPVNKLDGRML